MTLRLRCPDCRAEVLSPENLEGKKVRCPKCRIVFRAVEDKAASGVTNAPPRQAPLNLIANAPPHRAVHRGPLIGAAAAVFLLLAATLIATVVFWVWSPSGPLTPGILPIAGANPNVPDDSARHDNSPFHLADVRKSVVFIRTLMQGGTSIGTGFLVSKDGLIATNRHVIQSNNAAAPSADIYVGVPSLADPDILEYFRAKVAYCSPHGEPLDFALLKIAAKPGYPPFRPLPLASAKLGIGDPAACIGYPNSPMQQPVLSFNKGSISASRVEMEGKAYYQTDAAVNPGNSGGPLVNSKGEAVGIVTSKLTNAANMGYAVFLSETGMAAFLNPDRFAALHPELGPMDAKGLPSTGTATLVPKANWQIVQGRIEEAKGVTIVDNGGAAFLITSKELLPENFVLLLECKVEGLTAANRPVPPPPNLMRSLYVRFGTDAADEAIGSMKTGVTVHLAAEQMQLGQDGGVIAHADKRLPEGPFVMEIRRRGNELMIVVDGQLWTRQVLGNAPSGSHKFSIGGDLSRLFLRSVMMAQLPPPDGPPIARNNPRPLNPVNPPADDQQPNDPPKPVGPKLEDAAAPAGYDGPNWTADVAKAEIPDKPAWGWLLGADFKVEEATLNAVGFLTMRQGKQFEPGAYLLFMGLPKSLKELEGKTYNIIGKQDGSQMLSAQAGRMREGEKLPTVQPFNEYNMKMEFGKMADGKLPGQIYICLPNASKSVVAGKFMVESR